MNTAQRFLLTGVIVCLFFVAPALSFAGAVYQDFEPSNGSDSYGWSLGSTQARLSCCGEPTHLGGGSWRVESPDFWNGTGIQSQVQRWDYDAMPSRNDRFIFSIYALPFNSTDNNVGVQFFDHGNYSVTPFEIWTTQTARYSQWTELHVLFSQLPADFNLGGIDKIQLINYWPGIYYFDDIAVMRQDRAYQSFEPSLRSNSTIDEYGWKWNEADFVGFSLPGEPVHEGEHSWKLVTVNKWGGCGLQSQEKRLLQQGGTNEQSFWHVDLKPEMNDRLTLWVYSLASNGMDNNIAVQFYDNGQHFTDETKVVAWTKETAAYGKWTRLQVLFKDLPSDLDLHDINKIQLQVYWPGTYYFDDIRATGGLVHVDKTALHFGYFDWDEVPPPNNYYYVEESFDGPDGPWHYFWSWEGYSAFLTSLPLGRISKTWYRVQWGEPDLVPPWQYRSQWSETIEYAPVRPVIKKARLKDRVIEWEPLPYGTRYEVEASASELGPWSRIYEGEYPQTPLTARYGEWYHLRASNSTGTTPWSPAISYSPGRGFVRASGTILKRDNGMGTEIALRGVNLGGYASIEKWMTGLGQGDTPNIEDEWSIRDILTQRFGSAEAENLLSQYRAAYLQPYDFDRLLEMGMNFVRLPFYYRLLQDASGNWLRTPSGEIDFRPLDRIVDSCADRGLYVLIDMHGAPGAQSIESHTGRTGFNKLFEQSTEGEAYRQQTVTVWQEIARHYKDNAAVAGYDLLNEPIGAAPNKEVLWSLYDRIYKAIRAIDYNHLIVMEGIWYPDPLNPNAWIVDWDTLPTPSSKGWYNVVYQFHYYLWNNDEDISAHKAYIDTKMNEAAVKQRQYYVPVMIGEFTGFSQRQIWEYYLARFNEKGFSWAPWTYKYQFHSSEWGLYTNKDYNDELPKFAAVQQDGSAGDTLERLREKLGKYDTEARHAPNVSLTNLLSSYFVTPLTLDPIGNKTVNEAQYLSFTVAAHSSSPGTLKYSASPLPAGATFSYQRFSWTPTYAQAGTYSIAFTVTDGISTDSETVTITVKNVLPTVTSLYDYPDPFSPNGDGKIDTTRLSASFNHTGQWRMQLRNSVGTLVREFTGQGMSCAVTWDGKNAGGTRVPDGLYTYTARITDAGGDFGERSSTIGLDTTGPVISNLTVAPNPFTPSTWQQTNLSFRVSETSYITVGVYTSGGALVRTLAQNRYATTGTTFSVYWNGRNASNALVPAGIYTFYVWVYDLVNNNASPYPITTTVQVK